MRFTVLLKLEPNGRHHETEEQVRDAEICSFCSFMRA
jgi:hypothetical protein